MAEQKAKVVHGPRPPRHGRPRVRRSRIRARLLKRIMAEVFQHYLPHCILVLICIVVSALANVQASLFLQTLIDDYIIPMTQQQDPKLCTAGRCAGARQLHLCGGHPRRLAQRPHHGQRHPGYPAQPAHPALHPHGEPAHQLL